MPGAEREVLVAKEANMPKNYRISRRGLITRGISTLSLAAIAPHLPASAKMQKIKGEEMPALTPYLLFEGHCRQAMEFYESCFAGELTLTKVKDSPAKDQMPAALYDKVVYARLRSRNVEISASDWLRLDQTPIRGNTVCLYLSGGTFQDLKSLFERLSEGAEVTDPLQERFFGTYGALNDKFGVRWMFQTDKKA